MSTYVKRKKLIKLEYIRISSFYFILPHLSFLANKKNFTDICELAKIIESFLWFFNKHMSEKLFKRSIEDIRPKKPWLKLFDTL